MAASIHICGPTACGKSALAFDLARLLETIEQLEKNPPAIDELELAESIAFLGWLADNHFTFLGSRDYRIHRGGGGETGIGLELDDRLAQPAKIFGKRLGNTLEFSILRRVDDLVFDAQLA